MLLVNLGDKAFAIARGERIAQLVVQRVERADLIRVRHDFVDASRCGRFRIDWHRTAAFQAARTTAPPIAGRKSGSIHLEVFAVLPVGHLGLEAGDLGVLDGQQVVDEAGAQLLAEEGVAAQRGDRLGQALRAAARPWSRRARRRTGRDRGGARCRRGRPGPARPCRGRGWRPARRRGSRAAWRGRPAPPSTRIMTPRLSWPQTARSGASECERKRL